MSDIEKIMDVPLGSVGGPEYIRQEQEAAIELLRQRVARAEEALTQALKTSNIELKDAKIRAAQNALETAVSDVKKVTE